MLHRNDLFELQRNFHTYTVHAMIHLAQQPIESYACIDQERARNSLITSPTLSQVYSLTGLPTSLTSTDERLLITGPVIAELGFNALSISVQ